MNSLELYAEAGCKAGCKAGRASKQRDPATAEFHSRWLRSAIALEADPYRTQARKVFDAAYSAEATPSVQLFR